MKARFEIVVELDSEQIAREAKRRGFTLARAHETVIADVENTLFDSIRHKDAVNRVGVTFVGGSATGKCAASLLEAVGQ